MPKRPLQPILTEAVLIVLSGAVIAFGANALSPHGINLKRNYFPADTTAPPPQNGSSQSVSNAVPAEEKVTERLKQKGLQPIDSTVAHQKYDDPRRLQGQIIFID